MNRSLRWAARTARILAGHVGRLHDTLELLRERLREAVARAVGQAAAGAAQDAVQSLLAESAAQRLPPADPYYPRPSSAGWYDPDGKHVASCGRDTRIRIWNTEDGALVKELGKQRGGQFKDWIHAISFSADGLWLAGGDMAGAVQVWSFAG